MNQFMGAILSLLIMSSLRILQCLKEMVNRLITVSLRLLRSLGIGTGQTKTFKYSSYNWQHLLSYVAITVR